MDGLLVIVVAGVYVALLVFAMRWAWRWSRAKGGSWIKASFFSLLALLAVYLPVFWNHIPVAMVHRSMCAQDAGFTAYVAAQDWLNANRERVRAVEGQDLNAIQSREKLKDEVIVTRFFSGLLRYESTVKRSQHFSVPIRRVEQRLVDEQSGKILAAAIDYARGDRENASLWLYRPSCVSSDSLLPVGSLTLYSQKLQGEIK